MDNGNMMPLILNYQFSQESQASPIKPIPGRETHGSPMAVSQVEDIGWFMENDYILAG